MPTRDAAPLVLVLADDLDVHADWVVQRLGQLGGRCLRLHPARFFTEGAYVLDRTAAACSGRLSTPGGAIALDEVTSVYHRRPDPPRPDSGWGLEPAIQDFWEREHAAVLEAVLATVPEDALWVNHPAAMRSARNKLRQLGAAIQAGLRIPDTVVTNKPEVAWEFFVRHDRSIVTKPMSFGRIDFGADATFLFTQVVPKTSSPADFEVIRRGSSILQERIVVDHELRVSMVGDQAHTLRIDRSPETPLAEAEAPARAADRAAWELRDWRAEAPDGLRYEPAELPPAVATALVELQQSLGLVSCQVDLIVTPEGEHVFLEANVNGQWLWAQIEADLPIGEAFCRLLLRAGSAEDDPAFNH